MEYPYRKYLKYLVSMRKDTFSIREECLRLSLPAPQDTYLDRVKIDLGTIPAAWEPSFNNKNEYFCRWLRKKGLIGFWRNDPDVVLATNFLYRTAVRKDFETLSMSVASIEDIREVLLIKYAKRLVPECEDLEAYCKYYWDLSGIANSDLIDFLSVYHNRQANLAAVNGDLPLSYAVSNLPEEVNSEAFYNNFLAMVNQQVSIARRDYSSEQMSGSMMMGLSALGRQATDAIHAREMIRTSGRVEVLDLIKEQALAFKMRKVVGSDILTIDEIILDENNSEEPPKNVHKLAIATK